MEEENKEIADSKNLSGPIFFKDQIRIDRTCSSSAQAKIYFGREAKMGVRVVLKQYTGTTF